MSRQHTRIILILFTITFFVASCKKDFLNLRPLSALVGESFYRNSADAEAAITTAYNSVRNFNTDNYAKITEATLKGIMIFNAQGLNFDSWSFDANDAIIDDVWQGAYEGVFRTNLVLQNVPKISMDDLEKQRIIGEAYFLRALFYFQLTTVFGDVPLVLEADPTDASKSALPKTTKEKIYGQMIDDLKIASSLLPLKSKYNSGDIGRATKGSAQALLGKVYLYEKDYTLSALYLDSVIMSSEYSLLSDFSELLVKDNNDESIFEIQYADQPGQGSARVENDYPQGQGGFSNLLPTQDLVNAFELYNGPGSINGRDSRLFFSIFQDGDPYDNISPVFKKEWTPTGFARKKGSFPVVRTNNANLGRNFPIIRLSDVLLMFAEASNENEDFPSAIWAINKVRERAKLPLYDLSIGSKEQIFLYIKQERRVELCFEHHYLNDLRRWGLAAQELASEGYKSPENDHFPIPQQEIENNDNLR